MDGANFAVALMPTQVKVSQSRPVIFNFSISNWTSLLTRAESSFNFEDLHQTNCNILLASHHVAWPNACANNLLIIYIISTAKQKYRLSPPQRNRRRKKKSERVKGEGG